MEIAVSLSALPPSLYRQYVKGWKPNPVMLKLFEKISGKKGRKAMRIYLDAKTDSVVKNIAQNVSAPSEVVDELKERGIEILDYVAGTGKDSHGRTVRIGRALKSPSAKKAFDSDPNRKSLVNATRGKKLICVSMHPYDIAGMSTDRGWVSCMNLHDGSNKRYVKDDVKHGTLIAYLIDPEDRNINKPIARVLAKPYFQAVDSSKITRDMQHVGNANVRAMYMVDYAYPDSTMPFIHVVQDWLEEHINPFISADKRGGKYNLANALYNDANSGQINYDIEAPLLRNDIDGFVQNIVKSREDKQSLFDLIIERAETKPKIALAIAKENWLQPASRYRSLATLLIRNKQRDVFRSYCKIILDKKNDKIIDALWEGLNNKPEYMRIFLDAMGHEASVKFLLSKQDADFWNARASVNEAFPHALAEIWEFVQHLPNADALFWYQASRINSDSFMTAYVDEEFDVTSDTYSEYVLAPAIGSLSVRQGNVPIATKASLFQNKKQVNEKYLELADMVFDGWKYISLEADVCRNLADELRPILVEKKLKKKELNKFLLGLDRFQYLYAAAVSLYPLYEITKSAHFSLVESSDSFEQIYAAIKAKAIEIAVDHIMVQTKEDRVAEKADRAAGLPPKFRKPRPL